MNFLLIQKNEPMISFWMGNFFEPAYSDKEFVIRALEGIQQLGGNAVNLDSKAWDDFYHFYETGEKSTYVEMQDFIIKNAPSYGLTHNFLALYANGDNLCLSGIRDCYPRYGEQITGADSKLLPAYKYWSPKTHCEMLKHIRGLRAAFKGTPTQVEFNNDLKYPFQMFVALPKPSFDADGVSHYRKWLKNKYHQNIQKLNEKYHTSYSDFDEITPEQYWFALDSFEWGDTSYPVEKDYNDDSVDLLKFADNQLYRSYVAIDYFKSMDIAYREKEPQLLSWHIISQWQLYFSNGFHYWFFANTGVDPWLLAPHVDTQTFFTLPADIESFPNPYVVSCETSMMRSINNFNDFIGGLYLGRYIFNDVYGLIPPSDAIASVVANGAKAIQIYGYNGLDDGGVIYRMPQIFKRNVKNGIDWFKRTVINLGKSKRRKDMAILFPASTMMFEAQHSKTVFAEHRTDLLGWYRALADIGLMIDFLHPSQVTAEKLFEYQALIIPCDSCYRLNRSLKLEAILSEFIKNGGKIIHGYPCEIVEFIVGEKTEPHELDAFIFNGEFILPQGSTICSYQCGIPIAKYNLSGKTAISHSKFGKGNLISFGFQYGFCHAAQQMPVVPHQYGRQEVSPVILMERSILSHICQTLEIVPFLPGIRGIEFAHYDNISIAINHTSIPVDLPMRMHKADWLYYVDGTSLAPGTAVAWTR